MIVAAWLTLSLFYKKTLGNNCIHWYEQDKRFFWWKVSNNQPDINHMLRQWWKYKVNSRLYIFIVISISDMISNHFILWFTTSQQAITFNVNQCLDSTGTPAACTTATAATAATMTATATIPLLAVQHAIYIGNTMAQGSEQQKQLGCERRLQEKQEEAVEQVGTVALTMTGWQQEICNNQPSCCNNNKLSNTNGYVSHTCHCHHPFRFGWPHNQEWQQDVSWLPFWWINITCGACGVRCLYWHEMQSWLPLWKIANCWWMTV